MNEIVRENSSHAVMAQRGEPHDSLYDLPSRRSKYGVIYADPPWSFRNWSAKGTGRNAASHYDCMDFEELKRLPTVQMAADDCVLFLWATDPLLPKGCRSGSCWNA